MTAETREGRVSGRYAFAVDGRQVLLALFAVVLIVAALGLAAAGLDAFNDLLARGLSSVGNPSG